jgi:hypothetical protein
LPSRWNSAAVNSRGLAVTLTDVLAEFIGADYS